jgi:hexosaminidase
MLTLRLSGETQELEPGLKLLANELFFREGTGQYAIHAVKSESAGFSITAQDGGAEVRFHEKSDFFRALPIFTQHAKDTGYTCKEAPCFEKTGVMIDCSRNAVPTVDSLKGILRKMALMGLNLGMMYTEDTYEIKTQPYFGYMRGRYTFDELKELDDYADTLGIELIPCIQTLAHLERALQWPALDHLRDGERVLMVGEEETYAFIEEMITAAAAPYRSNRIHIGMDEAWELGLERYLNKKGYRPCGELMKEHLERVDAILKKHDLHAMMWSDMHFTAASPTRELYDVNGRFTPEILAGAPENIDLVYWDYYNENQEHYEKLLQMHSQFSAKTVFAGGIWTWTGPAADYRKTVEATLPALKACKKCGIKEVIATAWGDDGAEANLQTILYGMQLYAEFSYTGRYDEKQVSERFEACCKIPGKAFLDLSLFNEIPGLKLMKQSTVTPAKTLLYEDPLMPLFEEDFRGLPCTEHYQMLKGRFENYAAVQSEYRLLFDFYAKLAGTIYHKCLWRDRAAACVRANNREEAAEVSVFADACILSIRALKGAWSSLWYATNKPFGFEVNDLRVSGLIGRFETAKLRMNQFARGEIDSIPELSEPKLPYIRNEDGTFRCVNSWGAISTVCRIVG